MQAGAVTAAVGRQTIDSIIGRVSKSNGGRSFTAHEARSSSSSSTIGGSGGATATTSSSSGTGGNGGRELKFMRFSLSFDVKSAELFILVRDPSSGKVIFRAPNVARPSPIDEVADQQEAELKAAMAGDGGAQQDNAAPDSTMAESLAAVASNSNAPIEAATQGSNRAAASSGESAARGQGVNVTA